MACRRWCYQDPEQTRLQPQGSQRPQPPTLQCARASQRAAGDWSMSTCCHGRGKDLIVDTTILIAPTSNHDVTFKRHRRQV